MTRGAHIVDVVDYLPCSFNPDTLGHLRNTIRKFIPDIEPNKLSNLINEFEHAASCSLALNEIIVKTRPSEVKKNLNTTIRTIEKLEGNLKSLDGVSKVLYTNASEVSLDEVAMFLGRISADLVTAKMEVNKLKVESTSDNKTSGIMYENLELGRCLVMAINSNLDVRATSTKDGLFEECFTIVLDAVSERKSPRKYIHTLVERVIRSFSK